MSRYILAPATKLDLKEINLYIARFNPAAAITFRNRIKQQCKLLADYPQIGQSRDDLVPNLRGFPVDSYLIFYRPIDGGVEIVRIVSRYRDLETLF